MSKTIKTTDALSAHRMATCPAAAIKLLQARRKQAARQLARKAANAGIVCYQAWDQAVNSGHVATSDKRSFEIAHAIVWGQLQARY